MPEQVTLPRAGLPVTTRIFYSPSQSTAAYLPCQGQNDPHQAFVSLQAYQD